MNAARRWLKNSALDILDSVGDAIICSNPDGTIFSANAASLRLFGYSDQEFFGKSVASLFCEEFGDEKPLPPEGYHYPDIDSRSASDPLLEREFCGIHKNGMRFPAAVSSTALSLESKQCLITVVRNISQRRQEQANILERVHQLGKIGKLNAMGTMSASIAHEVNQPLTAIATYAQAGLQLFNRDETDLNRIKDALEKIQSQALRAGAVIERVQRFMNHKEGQRSLFDVNHLIKELENLTQGDERNSSIQIDYDLTPNLPRILCDSIQIQQVLLNLLHNGIDSMREIGFAHGHRLQISTSRQSGYIEVAVIDHGAGIDCSASDLLTEAFHSTKESGMGIGLAICKTIIDAHHGKLNYSNNAQGYGATFTFALPITETKSNFRPNGNSTALPTQEQSAGKRNEHHISAG